MSLLKSKQIHVLDLSKFSVEKSRDGLLLIGEHEEIELKLSGPEQESKLVAALFGVELLLDPKQISEILGKAYSAAVKLFSDGEIQDFSPNSYKKGSVLQVLRLKAGLPGLTPEEREAWEKSAEQ